MATSPTSSPGSLTAAQIAALSPLEADTYFANEAIQNDYLPEALQATHDNAVAWQNAVDAAAAGGGVAPVSYIVVTVDQDLVMALYTGAPVSVKSDGTPKSWRDIFIETPFVPASVSPAPLPVIQGARRYYLAADGTIRSEGGPAPTL